MPPKSQLVLSLSPRRFAWARSLAALFFLIEILPFSHGQIPTFESVWVNGSSSPNQAFVWGTKGVPNAANTPGARTSFVGWYDETTKELWIHGGLAWTVDNSIAVLDDMFRFRLNESTWTWMDGNNFTMNQPRKTYFSSETTPMGRTGAAGCWDPVAREFWMYGGAGWDSQYSGNFKQLWKYKASTSVWTQVFGDPYAYGPYLAMSGFYGSGTYGTIGTAGGNPGARISASAWCDPVNREFWLFGGQGADATGSRLGSGFLNDLWTYKMDTGVWTWMGGTSVEDSAGVYGTKGTADTNNTPGGRIRASVWFDSANRELWLFGGSNPSGAYFNDLWRFKVSTGAWTWINGSDTTNQASNYGTQGVPNGLNTPGARSGASTWFDSNLREMWLFGGASSSGNINDLWKFSLSSQNWAWMKGPKTASGTGTYGTKGVANAANVPASRMGGIGFYVERSLWLFGGSNYDDLWNMGLSYALATPQFAPQSAPQFAPQAAPQAPPQATPQAAPQSAPQTAPQTSAQPAPQAAAEATPQGAPQQVAPQEPPQVPTTMAPTQDSTESAPQNAPHSENIPVAPPAQIGAVPSVVNNPSASSPFAQPPQARVEVITSGSTAIGPALLSTSIAGLVMTSVIALLAALPSVLLKC